LANFRHQNEELGTKTRNQELQAQEECGKQVVEPIPATNTKPQIREQLEIILNGHKFFIFY